jgi:hypothetical protein
MRVRSLGRRSRAEPDNPPRGVAAVGLREQPRRQIGPALDQSGTDEQQQIGAQTRFVRRGYHHAGFTHDVKVAQKCFGMHVVDCPAQAFGQRDGGARACDIGAEACDDRHPARPKQSCGLHDRRLQRHRIAPNPSFSHARSLSPGVIGSGACLPHASSVTCRI